MTVACSPAAVTPNDFLLAIHRWLDAGDLDLAVDAAARAAHAVVAAYAAAPADRVGGFSCIAVQMAVEFIVPAVVPEAFRMSLDGQLCMRSSLYADERRLGRLAAPLVWTVPPGTFHQWRLASRRSDQAQRSARWTSDDAVVQSVLEQGRIGWRDIDG